MANAGATIEDGGEERMRSESCHADHWEAASPPIGGPVDPPARLFLVADALHAVTYDVYIRVGEYKGQWGILELTGSNPASTGDADIKLPAGRYHLLVALPFVYFEFDVSAAGVAPVGNAAQSADLLGSTVALKNATMRVDVGAFTRGLWGIWGVNTGRSAPKVEGSADVVVVPGLARYVFTVGYDGRFSFDVDAAGQLRLADDGPATVNGATLTLRTTTIRVDAGCFSTGQWGIAYIDVRSVPNLTGSRSFIVVPSLRYQLMVGYDGRFLFTVDRKGDIVLDQTGYATASGPEMRFVTAAILVNGSAVPDVRWGIAFVSAKPYPRTRGQSESTVVRALRYQFMAGWDGRFAFDVDASGRILDLPSPGPASAVNAAGSISELRLNGAAISVAVNGYAGLWGIVDVLSTVNNGNRPIAKGDNANIYLVPGVRYRFLVGNAGNFPFDVSPAGRIVIPPESAASATSVNGGRTLRLETAEIVTLNAAKFESAQTAEDLGQGKPMKRARNGSRVLVKGLRYVSRCKGDETVEFEVDRKGKLGTPHSRSLMVSNGRLRFLTEKIEVSAPAGVTWSIRGARDRMTSAGKPVRVELIRAVSYWLIVKSGGTEEAARIVCTPQGVTPGVVRVGTAVIALRRIP